MKKGIQTIVFEGGEGCGKSTQVALLKDYFQEQKIDSLFLREPGGTSIGEQIRNVLVAKENGNMTPECEAMLFAAARSQNIKENILPALASGKIVVLDRFVESSYVYQGYARDLSMYDVIRLNDFVLNGFQPDITLFLDINPEKAIERIKTNNRETNRLDLESMEFMRKVYEGYMIRAKDNPGYVVINADAPAMDIFEEIKKVLEI